MGQVRIQSFWVQIELVSQLLDAIHFCLHVMGLSSLGFMPG